MSGLGARVNEESQKYLEELRGLKEKEAEKLGELERRERAREEEEKLVKEEKDVKKREKA